jgi:predicted dehydrogenase
MKKIRWGIIGCGDVTELKSGPAFNKVNNSELVAVMRRNANKAKDYAVRHNVPKWYTDANDLINDPDINAVYIATPPSSHEEYTMAVLNAGKPVYVEKPMTIHAASAARMMNAVAGQKGKLVVAHYRRAQPLFKKIKQLVADNAIGNTRFARLTLYKKSYTQEDLDFEKTAWRVDPALAGGGLFHDLSPHQLDLMIYFFGEPERASGIANNQAGLYAADDMVTGNILFKSGVQFSGIWCFNVPATEEEDSCEIVGDKGKIIFSFFEHRPVRVIIDGTTETISFDPLQHVQQPMIEQVVNYFLDEGPNPNSAEEGVKVMKLIDQFTMKY